MPRLSLLIPSYCYPGGVARILSALPPFAAGECEVLVFDDTPGDEVALTVAQIATSTGMPLQYRHNRPALGAVANWNALLDQACGDYVLLMHHDEFPVDDHFVAALLLVLNQPVEVDVLLLDCVLVDSKTARSRRHIPSSLRLAVARHAPGYLLRRNVIGAASCMVVRRDLYPRFEPSLRWLVDVDLYVRLLRAPGCREVRSVPIAIGSEWSRGTSITAGLAPDIKRIEADEREWLHKKLDGSEYWLNSGGRMRGVVQSLELAAWMLFRAMQRGFWLLGVDALKQPRVRRAMRDGQP